MVRIPLAARYADRNHRAARGNSRDRSGGVAFRTGPSSDSAALCSEPAVEVNPNKRLRGANTTVTHIARSTSR